MPCCLWATLTRTDILVNTQSLPLTDYRADVTVVCQPCIQATVLWFVMVDFADVLVSDPEADFGGTNRGGAYVLLLLPSGTVKDFVVLTATASNFSVAFPNNGRSFASTWCSEASSLM